jgi:hypothetical protein
VPFLEVLEVGSILDSGRPSAVGFGAGNILEAPDYASFVHVVWRHFHLHAIPNGEANPPFAHFSRNCRQHQVFVIELDPKHRPRQDRLDIAFDFDTFFFHKIIPINRRLLSDGSDVPEPTEGWQTKLTRRDEPDQ